MQRQSLGSPVSKLHSHGAKDETLTPDDSKRNNRDMPSPNSLLTDFDDEDDKSTKNRRFSSSSLPSLSLSLSPQKLIHLIPILTLLCFFILYFLSHTPSPSDLAQFHGFKRSSKHMDSSMIGDDVERLVELRRADVLAIRSLRNLQEITDKRPAPKSRSHRKAADF